MSIHFITKSFKNKDGSSRNYLYLVESKREGKKVRQKHLACLGRLEELINSGGLDKLAEKLVSFSQKLAVLNAQEELFADWSKDYAPILIFRKLWDKLELGSLLSQFAKDRKFKFDPAEAIFSMVCNHLLKPGSELAASEWKEQVYEPKWESLELQHYYRALDYLVENKRELEKAIFYRLQDLFAQELDLLMFDTTTLYSYGNGKRAEVLQYGYSKDHRGDLRQIMVGVLMTRDGYPVGHEVFPGNLGDIKAFQEQLDKVKREFNLRRVIWVCDRGMISEKNIRLLEDSGYEYILGVRMRQLDEEMRKELLGKEDFSEIIPEKLWVKEKLINERRYIVCYNPEQAGYEQKKRASFREILVKKVELNTLKDWIVKNGYKKYISIKGGEVELDEEKLEREAVYDGMWILLTNTSLSSREVSLYYKGLWQIEQAFRELKSRLESAPLYHWTEKRIRAHVFVCFLALLLKISLKKALRAIKPEANYSEIMEEVGKIKALQLRLGGKIYVLRTELPPGAYTAFRALGLKLPNRILEVRENVLPTSDHDQLKLR